MVPFRAVIEASSLHLSSGDTSIEPAIYFRGRIASGDAKAAYLEGEHILYLAVYR